MRYTISIILLFLTFSLKAQVYQQMPQAGYGPIKRFLVDSVLTLPLGISKLQNISGGRDTGQIRYNKSDSTTYIYTGSQWQKVGGETDTSSLSNRINLKVNISDTAAMLAPYLKSAVTSVGLSMPSAFTVSNSPVTSTGTIAVTGAGTAAQYVRGDGQLATLPSAGTGGGSSVYYYLNGSVTASVAGYKQVNKTAIIGGGTDFSLAGNGLIAQFITDVNDPNRLEIPAGAWNFETFFNASSAGGTPAFYIELLKYNGSTFTTIANTSAIPELITSGTITDLYLTSMAVPYTTLLITDRLVIRIYIVNSVGGRTITLHTEDNHLCQITTTFAGGISSLNGLNGNTQYLATGTSGTDFNISSLTDTHTFNLPTASASNRGALSSADWTIFNGKMNYTDTVSLSNRINTKQNILTNPITGTGTSGQIAYWNGTNSQTGSATLTYTPTSTFLLNNSVTAASGIAQGKSQTSTLIAAANSDVLVGLDINPTFTNGAFTGVNNYNLRLNSASSSINEVLNFYNANNTGGSGSSITYRNNVAGNYIWSSINLLYPAGAGGKIEFNTSNGGGLNATTKMTIFPTGITSSVLHTFSAGIVGNVAVQLGSSVDAAPGFGKNLSATINDSQSNSSIAFAAYTATTQSINTNAIGIYINNAATVSGTGAKYNIYSIGTGLNHFNGNVLLGSTTDDGINKLQVTGSGTISGALNFTGGTSAAGNITYNTSYGLLLAGKTGSSSDLTFTDRSGNLRFQIVNGGNIIQTTSKIGTFSDNTVTIGGGTGTKLIYGDNTYGLVLIGNNAASIHSISLFGDAGTKGLYIKNDGSIKIGLYNATFNTSAILEAVSTTQGFLQPRMTTTQKLAIATPAEGLTVYDLTLHKLCVYTGSAWETITSL